MSLTKVSFSMLNGAPANVLDYGADSTGATDSTVAIQAAIDAAPVVYIPSGTYLISGAINVGSSTLGNKKIVGAGFRSTTLKATNAAATLQNKTQHYFIEMEEFTFDGDDIATVGISLGIPSGGTGSAGYDFLTGVHVVNCVTAGLQLNSIQYTQINQCQFQGTSNGHGIIAKRLLSSYINNTVVIDNRYGMYLGNFGGANSDSTLIYLNNVQFFGPAPASATPPDGYLIIDGAYGVWLNDCIFENERVFNNALVIIKNTEALLTTANIYFEDCVWQGLSYAQDLIEIQGSVTRVFFNDCRAIKPAGVNYILNNLSSGSVFVTDCFRGNGYTDLTTFYWTEGGYVNGAVIENRSAGLVYFKNTTTGMAGINTDTPLAVLDIKPTFITAGVLVDIQYLYGTTGYSTRGGFNFKGTAAVSALNRRLSFDHLTQTEFNIQGIVSDGTSAADVTLTLQKDGGTAIRCGTVLTPTVDNTTSLGAAIYRWSVVYAATGAINTSDGREKQDIQSLDATEKAVALDLKSLVKRFRFKDAVTLKGDEARIHVGVVAQEVVECFKSHGLDAHKYALLCYDSWDETLEVKDEEGNITQPYVPAGNRYGVRYDELLAFIISAI
jgi:hypothetical protein